MRYEDKIDDEMFKSMVYYKRETKMRWPALKDVEGRNYEHGCSCPSRCLLGVWQCANGCARDNWDPAPIPISRRTLRCSGGSSHSGERWRSTFPDPFGSLICLGSL